MNELIQTALTNLGDFSQFNEPLTSARSYIEDTFGTPGLIAAGILIAAMLGLILSKLVKMSFDVVRYVAVPSVATTFIATYFLPFSFIFILPVTVAFFSIILIIKG